MSDDRESDGDPRPRTEADSAVDRLVTVVGELRAARERDRVEFLRHGLVDQAVGVLIGRSGCSSAEAFKQLADIERRSGRSLLEIAADLVGEPMPEVLSPRDADDVDRVRLRPAVLATDRAADADDLARLLAKEALGWSSPSGVVIAHARDDGALELIGATGFAAVAVEQWRRIPPAMDCLLNRAVRTRTPTWTDAAAVDLPPLIGEAAPPLRPADGTRVAVPIVDARKVLGAVEVAWPTGTDFTADERREIMAVVGSVAVAFIRTPQVGSSPDDPADAAGVPAPAEIWRAVIDGLGAPAVVLRPIHDEQHAPTDFKLAGANREAAELLALGADPSGHRLLAVAPWLAHGGFDRISEVLRTGVAFYGDQHRVGRARIDEPGRTTDLVLSAAKIGDDTILLTLRPVSTGPVSPDVWSRVQRLGRIGTWEWDVSTGEARWSAESLRILGSRTPPKPTPISSPPYKVHPEDATAAQQLISALVDEGRPADAELRILGEDGTVIYAGLAGEPVSDAGGKPVSVFGVVRDVSDRRRAETALEVAQVQLAAQRSRVDAERQLAILLQQIILPAEPVQTAAETGIEVAARYRPASAVAGVGGDWYGIFPLPDAKVLLTVGDVAGHGLSAASAMAQLYHALRGLAVTGAGPAEIMTWLNTLTCELPSFTIASACSALYDPAERQLCWANAGHPSPVLVRREGAQLLRAPIGTMLGASADSEYHDTLMTVDPGDVLLLYTDGLVERRRQSHDQTTGHLLDQAVGHEADLEEYVDRILDGARSDTDDDTCLIAVRFR